MQGEHDLEEGLVLWRLGRSSSTSLVEGDVVVVVGVEGGVAGLGE